MRVEHGDLVDFALRNFSVQNFEIAFVSTKLGASFNSKSASNSRFVRATNCRAFLPVTTNAVFADRNSPLRETDSCSARRPDPLSVLMIRTSSFFTSRICKQRMQRRIGPFLKRNQHLVHQRGIRSARQACCCALRIFDAATICIALVIWPCCGSI